MESDFRGYWKAAVERGVPMGVISELCAAGCSVGFDLNVRPRPELFAAFYLVGITRDCKDVEEAWRLTARSIGYADGMQKCSSCGFDYRVSEGCGNCGGPY